MRLRFEGIEIGSTSRRRGEILINSIDFGSTEYVTADNQREGSDGVTPGRDYLGRTTLLFNLTSNQKTMREARDTLSEFLAAWKSRTHRLSPGTLVALEYSPEGMDGEWFRVYGRPRAADPYNFDVLMRQGAGKVQLEFDQLEPRYFSGGLEGEQSVTVRATAEASGTGWRFPARFPLRSAEPPEPASSVINVGGEEPTSPTIEFHGPGRGFLLTGNAGWRMGLRPDVELAYDESIIIDPLARTVRDNWGEARYGALDIYSTLGGITLRPGTETVFFSAEDITGNAHAIIRWRDARTSA